MFNKILSLFLLILCFVNIGYAQIPSTPYPLYQALSDIRTSLREYKQVEADLKRLCLSPKGKTLPILCAKYSHIDRPPAKSECK